jgi:GTP-binding protein
MFIDYAEIKVIAGAGGSGCLAFLREKYVPDGGPSGGDGGNGSSIYMQADSNLTTLMDIRYKRIYKGDRGQHGMGSNMHGKKARNITIKVPVGTIVKDKETGDVLFDFIAHGQKELIAKGGRGGRGNARFATATNRAPRKWEYGRDGEEVDLIIEMKLFADIGLVGFPNAGKSTLLSVMSAARPKIADYPFTTLEPQLGIINCYDIDQIVMADIPGIIEGASEGKGLGHKFLKHIERTKTIAYVIDGNEEDIASVFQTLQAELKNYSPILSEKPALVIITKADSYVAADLDLPSFGDYKHIVISSVARENLTPLLDMLWEMVKEGREIYDVDYEDDKASDEFDF